MDKDSKGQRKSEDSGEGLLFCSERTQHRIEQNRIEFLWRPWPGVTGSMLRLVGCVNNLRLGELARLIYSIHSQCGSAKKKSQADPFLVYWDVEQARENIKVGSATSISVCHHVTLFGQIRCRDTLSLLLGRRAGRETRGSYIRLVSTAILPLCLCRGVQGAGV